MNRVRASIVAAALIAIAPAAAGQSLPRTSDGKPELSGIWQAVNTAAWNILPHSAEAATKPAMQTSRKRLRPRVSEKYPVSGMTIAEETR